MISEPGLVGMVITGVVGCVSIIAILSGSIKLKADKGGLNLEAAAKKEPIPAKSHLEKATGQKNTY